MKAQFKDDAALVGPLGRRYFCGADLASAVTLQAGNEPAHQPVNEVCVSFMCAVKGTATLVRVLPQREGPARPGNPLLSLYFPAKLTSAEMRGLEPLLLGIAARIQPADAEQGKQLRADVSALSDLLKARAAVESAASAAII